MMGLSAILEDFGSKGHSATKVAFSEDILESERLESFDKGYRAGWDDAVKACSDDASDATSGLAEKLHDLSFAYHEIHAQVFSNLAPLFDEILQKLLPSIARDTLAPHIVDQLAQIARDLGTVQIEIAVAPGSGDAMTQIVTTSDTRLPLSVREEPHLDPGQAELRYGGREISVDLRHVAEQVAAAVRGFVHEKTKLQAHG